MAISSSEKRKGILRPFDVIEERLAKLNTSNFAYYLIGEDYCDSQPVSRIFSSGRIFYIFINDFHIICRFFFNLYNSNVHQIK
jgi:hypothetical protein